MVGNSCANARPERREVRIHIELGALAGTADSNPESVPLPFLEANRRITIMRKGFAIEHIRPLDELTLRSDTDRTQAESSSWNRQSWDI